MQDMRESHRRKILNLSLRNDESGIALFYVTFALPVMIGLFLVTVGVGRFVTLHSSLAHAHGVDVLALAGAAQLDGTSYPIARAESAMSLFTTDNAALFSSSSAAIKPRLVAGHDRASQFTDVSTVTNRAFALTETDENLGTSGSS